MPLPAKVLVHAIRQYKDNPEAAANLIREYESRRDKTMERYRKISDIRLRADREIAALLSVKLCHHEVRETHGDPSGGSDSHEQCLICGEVIREKEVRFT